MTLRFQTDYRYVDRKTKSSYVWKKYGPILRHSVLDVGADECHIRPFVEEAGGRYQGIGYGANVDQEIDLESAELPYSDRAFETVLCLDVLEHLESAHRVFSELCRVSGQYVVISLPNAWHDFWNMLRSGDYAQGQPIKFYGFPEEPPRDRHRWFFGVQEAKRFLAHNAEKNGYEILQTDNEPGTALWMPGWRGRIQKSVFKKVFRKDLRQLDLTKGPLWCVLSRKGTP